MGNVEKGRSAPAYAERKRTERAVEAQKRGERGGRGPNSAQLLILEKLKKEKECDATEETVETEDDQVPNAVEAPPKPPRLGRMRECCACKETISAVEPMAECQIVTRRTGANGRTRRGGHVCRHSICGACFEAHNRCPQDCTRCGDCTRTLDTPLCCACGERKVTGGGQCPGVVGLQPCLHFLCPQCLNRGLSCTAMCPCSHHGGSPATKCNSDAAKVNASALVILTEEHVQLEKFSRVYF